MIYFNPMKNTFIKVKIALLAAVLGLCQTNGSYAQMVGANAYTKGTSVEYGIDGPGGFEGVNTTTSPPLAGMHPRSATGFFGFVANPQLNAWLTFDGDFFTPGSPENGWGLEIGASSYVAFGTPGLWGGNNCSYTNEIPGSITNWNHIFNCYSTDWESNMTNGGTNLHIKINYLLQQTDLYYTTTVSIKNNTTAVIPEIYYYRNLDPDNNEEISFDFTTQNTIVSEPTSSGCGLAHVKATSSVPASQPMSYLGLAAVGANWRAGYGGFSNRDASDMWTGGATATGTFTETVGATNFADEAIYLAYKISNLAPGATETFKFVVILDDASATAAINNLSYFSYAGSASAPPATCTPFTDTVRTCGYPATVSVAGPVASDYTWTWSPGTGLSSTTGTTVSANPPTTTTYTVTGTPINPCLPPTTMNIVVQVLPGGTAPPVITPVAPICSNATPITMTADIAGGAWSGPGITNSVAGTFDPAVSGPGTFMIEYLTPAYCNNYDSVMVTVLNSSSATITQPAFQCANSPAFNLTAAAPGGTWSGTGITSTSAGTFDPSVAGAGSYVIQYSIGGTCPSQDTVTINVGAVTTPITGFNYPDTLCVAAATQLPTPVTGFTTGGTFSSTPGLGLNTTTGLVNPATSTAGTYVVTYTVPATICGPAGTSKDTIIIKALTPPTLGISYTQPVCATDTNQSPIPVAGLTPGGTYSASPAGLNIDPVTGTVNVAASTPGTYTITYSVTGSNALCTASGSTTASFTVNPLPSITISPDVTMWLGSTGTLWATDGSTTSTYVWTTSDPTAPVITCDGNNCDTAHTAPEKNTTYCVHVTTNKGCVDSSCMKINIVIPCISNRNLDVPNAFTPNGDGNNDELCLSGWDDCVVEFEIKIFDRWGAKVFESKDPSFCWNGVYNGKPLDPAVFVYFIKATYATDGATVYDPKGTQDYTKTGNISLLR